MFIAAGTALTGCPLSPLKKNIYKELFMTKRFSLKNKLVFIFGALIALASLIEGLLAIRIARKAVMEKVTTQLIDKANDTTEIIDGRIPFNWHWKVINKEWCKIIIGPQKLTKNLIYAAYHWEGEESLEYKKLQ